MVPGMKLDPTPYTAIVSASNPNFSTDAKTLFHLRGAGLQQVWTLDLDSGESRQLTRHDEKVALLRRAPNDDRLIYGVDGGGDERQALWLLDGAEARPLTSAPEVIHGFGAWHPDGTRFSLTANDRDEAHYDILVQDLASGERTRIHEGRHEMTVAAWHKDGQRLIALEDRATSDQRPFILGLDGTVQWIPRTRPTRFSNLRWDGEQLMGLTDAHGGDFIALCRIDPASGAAIPVFAPEGRDVEAWSLASAGNLLATIENDRGYGVLRVGPLDGERPVAAMPDGVAADPSWSADGTRLAFNWSSPEKPSGLYLWENGTVSPAWVPALDLPTFPFRLIEWTSFDGRTIPGWLAIPANGTPNGARPAVIWVHGGPASQTRPAFRPDMQALLSRGYAVMMPNVRGSTGYGRASMDADDRELRLDSVHDLAAGRHFLAAQPGIDPDRIAVMGQSYGGYMVMAAVTEYPDLCKAAINFYGIADFVTLLEQTGPWRQAHRSEEYGDIVRHRALFDRISPIRHIDRLRAPLLVLHGTRDPRVPFGESVQIVDALQLRQRKVRFETFDYAGHGFIRPDDKARVYRAVAEWLDAHV